MIVVRDLTVDDLGEVASLHLDAFPRAVLSALGVEPVRRYYVWQLIGPHDVHAIGAFDRGVLFGFCVGGRFDGSMVGFLRTNFGYLVRRALVTPRLWVHPELAGRVGVGVRALLRRGLRRRRPPRSTAPGRESSGGRVEARRSFSIQSIAVTTNARRMGVGTALLDAAEAEARRRGDVAMNLTVHPDNSAAVAFYERHGWRRRESLDGSWTGAMVRSLTADGGA